jgi:hypothetical protein
MMKLKQVLLIIGSLALALLIAIGSRVLLSILTGGHWPWYLF